jgi:hypothetical protein
MPLGQVREIQREVRKRERTERGEEKETGYENRICLPKVCSAKV